MHTFCFLLFTFFSICQASELNLRDYARAKNSPVSYTLALLDRSMVVVHTNEIGNIPTAVQAFIHSSAREGGEKLLRVKSFPKTSECFEHYVVQLNHRKAILRAAALTEELFRDDEDIANISDIDPDESEDDNEEDDDLEEELEYAASMVLFPVEEDSDKVIAYLLGGWPALLNTTSVVPTFGLKIITSIGVAVELGSEHKFLSNIKEIVTETRRLAKPIRGKETQQKGLGKINDFGIDPAGDCLEKVRLKPIENWGNALLDGDDFFKFRLTTKKYRPTKKERKGQQKLFNQRHVMYEVAKEAYKIYTTGAIHKDFLPYLDEPVREDLYEVLNKALIENWESYFNEEQSLYMHWTFWFRARAEKDLVSVIKRIKESRGEGTIEIGGHYYKPTQLVRSLPIPFRSGSGREDSYYWFDRGSWYCIPATRFEIIKRRIADVTVSQSALFLPDYRIDPKASDDYKELAYNKLAVEFMRSQQDDLVSEAILLDRENVPLGGRDDKFEFADILLQNSLGKYFLIHVKRERSRQIDHHRTQAERCALYLGENLDRGALSSVLVADILRKFYEKNILIPRIEKYDPKTGDSIEVSQSWSTSFREKIVESRKMPVEGKARAVKRKKNEEFLSYVEDIIFKVNKRERKFIKRIVTSDKIKPLISRFEPYEEVLGRCLDALEDYVLYATRRKVTDAEMDLPVVYEFRIDFVRQFFEEVLSFLEKHAPLVRKHQGILPHKDRENIVVVLAIIGDGSGKEEFHRQQLWGMDQTRKLVEKQGFGFQVVFIKDKTKTANIVNDKEEESLVIELIEEESDSSMALYDPLPFDQQAFIEAQKRAIAVYCMDSWYRGVKKNPLRDNNSQNYVRVVVDSSRGDCCFHALLGTTREKTIDKMLAYIDELDGMESADLGYTEFIDKCASDFWKKVGDDALLASIEAYLKKIEVLSPTGEVLKMATDADLDFTALKEQKAKIKKDINKKRPRDATLKAEKEFRIQALSEELAELESLEKKCASEKIKNYIKYKIEFQKASAARKKEILTDFYLTNREWFDPSAVMHLGSRFGFKAKLYKRDNVTQLLSLFAQTPDADIVDGIPCRLAVYVNGNHYDLLFPF